MTKKQSQITIWNSIVFTSFTCYFDYLFDISIWYEVRENTADQLIINSAIYSFIVIGVVLTQLKFKTEIRLKYIRYKTFFYYSLISALILTIWEYYYWNKSIIILVDFLIYLGSVLILNFLIWFIISQLKKNKEDSEILD